MTRYTLKQLKEMVRSGIAMDLTKASNKEYKELIARGRLYSSRFCFWYIWM